MKKNLFTCVLTVLMPLLFTSIAFAEQLSLKQSLEIAMEKSPAIISARESVRAADGKLGQAFGAILPALSVSGQVGSGYSSPGKLGTFVYGTTEVSAISGYNFTLNQPLDITGSLIAGLDMAESGYKSAKESLRKAEFDLKYNVVNAYYGVLRARKLDDLAQDSLDMANSHLAQVKALFAAGTATKADVLRVEVQAANMELGKTKADNALALAKDAFNNVLGRDLDADVMISEKEIVSEMVQPMSYKESLSYAFENKPDWLIFLYSERIAEKSSYISYAGYFPMFALTGTYGNNRNEYPFYPGSTDITSWNIMATGSWKLFDGLATPSKVKESEANLGSLRAQKESVRNGIMLEVKDACLNLSSAVDVIKNAKKSVDLAEENYRISKEKYANGAGSNLEMIDAQTALAQAKTNLYQAQFDYQITKVRMNQVVGKEIYPF